MKNYYLKSDNGLYAFGNLYYFRDDYIATKLMTKDEVRICYLKWKHKMNDIKLYKIITESKLINIESLL